MNKKYVLGLSIILIITLSMSIWIFYNHKFSKKEEVNNEMISIMLETEDGKYVSSSERSWPTSGYVLNTIKSYCENGSTLAWNKETKKVRVNIKGTDKCYVYFDKENDLSNCLNGYDESLACELIKKGDKTLIYHDGKCDYEGEENCELEAEDFNYRYSGSSEEVHNYVCFGSDEENCPEDNLYRIIGIFDGNIKLIKNTYATITNLGQSGAYTGSDNKYYKDSVNWNESLLVTENLNNYFFNIYLETKWQDLIDNVPFIVTNAVYGVITDGTAKNAFTATIKKVGYLYNEGKIGLMYVSDYGYGMSYKYWDYRLGRPDLEGNNYSLVKENNWLWENFDEWILQTNGTVSFKRYATGVIGTSSVKSINNYIRPVFYLKKEVKKVSGTGEANNPYRISL